MLRTRLATTLVPLLLSAVALVPAEAPAAMYKCVDANGDTTYTQTRCPTSDARVESIATARPASADRDCGIVRHFAARTARSMKGGRSSSAVFGAWGGLDALSPAAIGVISYVYEFRGNERASAARITELAVGRCRGGSFGEVGCDAFPTDVVAAIPACHDPLAFDGLHPYGVGFPPEAFPAAHAPDSSRPARAADRAASTATAAERRTALCRADVATRIAKVNADMRASLSVSGQERLRDRRRTLGRALRDC